jgi:bifunctional ADP-heptose synthase (sugar kinase/adenylyltransferase)
LREAAQIANYAAGVEVDKAGLATASPIEVLSVHDTYHDQLGRLRRGGLL